MRSSILSLSLVVVVGAVFGCGGDDDGPGGGIDSGVIGVDSGGGGIDAGGTGTDAGPGVDAGDAVDGGGGDTDGGGGDTDGGPIRMVDAGSCGPTGVGACPAGTMCLCCPAGGPAMNCLCTTSCMDDGDCDDASRDECNRPMRGPGGGGAGICTPMGYRCSWGAVCASPDTPIATPDGERAIAELREGDLVYSVDGEQVVAVPIRQVSRTAVRNHVVVRLGLDSGRVVAMSAGHPTADGRTFGELAVGDDLGGPSIVAVETIPFEHPFTYDILPASDTGQYFAAGALVGSTLAE